MFVRTDVTSELTNKMSAAISNYENRAGTSKSEAFENLDDSLTAQADALRERFGNKN